MCGDGGETTLVFLRPDTRGAFLSVLLQPRAKRTGLISVMADRLKVGVAAPPIEDRANEELRALLARTLRVSKAQITIVRGRTSRRKEVLVAGVTARETALRLEAVLPAAES